MYITWPPYVETSCWMPDSLQMATPLLLHLVFFVEIVVYCRQTIGDDVFASSAQLRMLEEESEVELIDALKSYIGRERQKMDELERSDQIESNLIIILSCKSF